MTHSVIHTHRMGNSAPRSGAPSVDGDAGPECLHSNRHPDLLGAARTPA